MHEAAILSALCEQVESFAPEGSVVLEVKIEVGRLEHLDSGVMTTLWEALTMDTRLAGSRLSATSVPVRVRCRECGTEHEPEDPAVLVCHACGAVRPEILDGTGVLLRSLEVEQ
jgi:hydrogenase nickel incorporation protein HypA/HybF